MFAVPALRNVLFFQFLYAPGQQTIAKPADISRDLVEPPESGEETPEDEASPFLAQNPHCIFILGTGCLAVHSVLVAILGLFDPHGTLGQPALNPILMLGY